MPLAWSGPEGDQQVVKAATEPGAASRPRRDLGDQPGIMLPDVAIDGAGDATAVWPRSNGSNDIVQFAGYDASHPS